MVTAYSNLLLRYNGYMRTNGPELGADFLVAFLNTLDVEEQTDALDDAAGFGAWAREHGVEPGEAAEARRVRVRMVVAQRHPERAEDLHKCRFKCLLF